MADSISDDKEAQHSGELTKKRGGWICFPFIIAAVLGFSITSFGWTMNLIVFLIEEFNVKSITAAQISNIANGCLSMFPVVAAVLADSFFGNIPVISASAFISLIGISLLTLIASFDYLKPQPCSTGSILCSSPSTLQFGVLYAALTLLIIGSAGSRVTLGAAGANQYDKPKDHTSFFNWFFLTLNAGAIISSTAIVYTQDNVSWKLGFGLCVAANLISFIIFVSGKRYYKHDKPMGSPFTSLIRVMIASTTKRRKSIISYKEEDYYKEKTFTVPSKSFTFLNCAAIKPEDDSIESKWRLCSLEEVEDFKSVLRLFPLWATILFTGTSIGMQASLVVLQALVTDRGLGPNFKVPAGSLQVIILISSCTFIVLNNWVICPLYKKLTHKQLTPLQLIGIGHVFIILSMTISAIVEAKRLKTVDDGHSMSVLWLFPPLLINGIGDAFTLPANIALFYGEFPESLKNTATSVTSIGIGVSFYLTTALTDVIQRTTKWLPNDINHGRVDNVYWLLVVGCVLNFGFFLICSYCYTYRNLQVDNGNVAKDVET